MENSEYYLEETTPESWKKCGSPS